jgi:[ribosomal protein S5]-alanine N-acetyltransferase
MLELGTERLRLRPFEPRDADALLAQWNDTEVNRYLFDGEVVAPETVRAQIESSIRGFAERGFGFFMLVLREAPLSVGFAGLRAFGSAGRVELLYALLPPWWGRGLATEAARAVLGWAFSILGLDEVWAGADPPNEASFRVMERLGMRFVEEVVVGGRPARYYKVTATDFSTSSSSA